MHNPVISFYYLCWTPHLSVIINACFLSLQSLPSTGSLSSKTLRCWRTSVIDRRSLFEVFFSMPLIDFYLFLTDVQIRKYFTMFENVNIFMLSRKLPLWRNNSAAATSLYKETGYIWRVSDVPISFSFWKLPKCSFLFLLLGTDWTMCLYVTGSWMHEKIRA